MNFISFTVAVKSPIALDRKEVVYLMEEAKNMLRIGTYHAHIVNLQGVICEVEKEGQRLSNVSNILWVFDRLINSVNIM